MGKKAGKQAVQGHSQRPKTTGTLSQPAATDPSTVLTRFSPSGRLFAQCSVAVDADSLRVFEVQSGQCVGRWTSPNAAGRISSLEWAELLSSSASSSSATGSDEKTAHRGRKRRKGANGENEEEKSGSNSTAGNLGTSSAQEVPPAEASSSAIDTIEVLALGLKNSSILIFHPTQSTIIHTLSHTSVTSPAVSLSSPAAHSIHQNQPSYLWSCTSTGQLSVWSLPRLSEAKGQLIAQYDTQCASCSQIAIRYLPGPNAQVNSDHESRASSGPATQTVTAEVLVGSFSIKLLETSMPLLNASNSDTLHKADMRLRSECSGHASEISQLLWLNRDPSSSASKLPTTSQSQFVSIAKGDRFVSVWSASTTTSAESTPTAGILVATLGLDEEPQRIALAPTNDVLCTVSADAARILSLEAALAPAPSLNTVPEQATGRQRKRKNGDVRTIKVLSTITTSQGSISCTDAFLPASPANTVYVTAGVLKPSIEVLSYRDDAGTYKTTLEISTKAYGNLAGVDGQRGAEAPRAAYSESRQSHVSSAEAARDPSLAFAPSIQSVDPAAEPTIAERLKDLHVKDGKELDMIDDPTLRKNRRSGARNVANKNRIADAMSTSQALVQALHSADVRLLETCLAEKNVKVIRATVRRVPSTLVLPLVEALVERLSRTRNGTGQGTGGVDASRGQVLIEWLRNVLIVHLAYLITLPSLVERLSALHATLESRMSFHSQLLALSGRLDLVVSQIDIRANPIQDAVVSQKSTPARSFNKPNAIPVKKYVEGEESETSSDSDDEDEEAANGGPMDIEPAEEGNDEDIEDLVMANGDLSAGELDDDDVEEEEDDSEEDAHDIPALRKPKSNGKPKMNGFLDVEAEESDNEGSDEDGNPVKSRSSGVKLNGVIHEDSLDEDEDDLDRYESDFINDDSDDDEDSGEEDDDGADE